jgi:hypothetical protein
MAGAGRVTDDPDAGSIAPGASCLSLTGSPPLLFQHAPYMRSVASDRVVQPVASRRHRATGFEQIKTECEFFADQAVFAAENKVGWLVQPMYHARF